jgi:uroporphyrinogen-III synthase
MQEQNNYSALIAFPEHKLNEFSSKLKLKNLGLEIFNFAVLKLINKEFELNNIESFDYIVLASSFAAEIFVKKIKLIYKNQAQANLNLPLILSVGPSISQIISSQQLNVYKQANTIFNMFGLINKIEKSIPVQNKSFLFLGQSKSNYKDLEQLIISKGGKFEKLIIYESQPVNHPDWESLNNFSQSINQKVLVFSSPEGIRSFKELIELKNINPNLFFANKSIKKIFCLGSLTQKEASLSWFHDICLCPENSYSYNSLIELMQKTLYSNS